MNVPVVALIVASLVCTLWGAASAWLWARRRGTEAGDRAGRRAALLIVAALLMAATGTFLVLRDFRSAWGPGIRDAAEGAPK